ncbi:DGQHR domain-containing protein [Sphingomonas ursincola]|uniref:DGQHR domain-containing protein n=1 Tax=Sphingomonas ursincola TaxID=56361 RepID=A0A7V8RAR2_9SPHN|nr:DGQHR domain-containing protein [Sphingomonas ursincola]MBA1373015.1 DGQHR domain-containing protein [Sphingomonas ursincola]
MANQQKLTFSVMPVQQKSNEFYISSIPARELVSISYADVRRLAHEHRDVERYLGIQRPVNPARIQEIRTYLEGPDATFPTGIIVAIDDRCVELDRENGTMTVSPFVPEEGTDDTPIPFHEIAKILDGQHRLAAFLNDDRNLEFDFDEDQLFQLNACIFVGADISTQAEIFATVNLAQTKVNRSLAYDLQEFAKSRSPFKTCHDVAVAMDRLDVSPLRNRIKRLGVRTKNRDSETITQAAFVESLVKLISREPMKDRNKILDRQKLPLPTNLELKKTPFRRMFIDEDDFGITEIILNFFIAVRNKWPQSWDDVHRKGNFIPRSNAFKALMRYLGDIYIDIVGEDFGRIPEPDEFSRYFDHIELTDDLLNTKTFRPGSSGQSLFYKLLTGRAKIYDLIE